MTYKYALLDSNTDIVGFVNSDIPNVEHILELMNPGVKAVFMRKEK